LSKLDCCLPKVTVIGLLVRMTASSICTLSYTVIHER
jgi:hypothetical protein